LPDELRERLLDCATPDRSHHPLPATETPGRLPPEPCRLSFAPSRQEMPRALLIDEHPARSLTRAHPGQLPGRTFGKLRNRGSGGMLPQRSSRTGGSAQRCAIVWMLAGWSTTRSAPGPCCCQSAPPAPTTRPRNSPPSLALMLIGSRAQPTSGRRDPVRGRSRTIRNAGLSTRSGVRSIRSGPNGCASRRGDPGRPPGR
jgi:hypothetical protein